MAVMQRGLGARPPCKGCLDDASTVVASDDSTCGCSSVASSPSTASTASSGGLETISDAGSEHESLGENGGREVDDAGDIQGLLEGMNSSSLEVNRLQGELARHRKQRLQLERIWAVSSARLARAAGPERISRARPLHEQRRRRDALQEKAQALSERYMQATEAAAAEADLAQISEDLARCLAKYQAAKQRSLEGPPSSPREDLALTFFGLAPFFEAEDEHRRQLAKADVAISEISRRLEAAKGRYRDALAGLECLSDHIHQRRSQALAKANSF